MKILITGSTGFIGRRLTNRLLDQGHEIYAIVRPQSIDKAKSLFKSQKHIHFVIGDVSNNDVLEHVSGVVSLPEDIECVVHLAAIYDLEVNLSDAYANNVVGTQNIIYLCQRLKNLKYYHHVSTYAVSGLHNGEFGEEELNPALKYPDFYGRTKMQAEYLVRNALMKKVKVRIYRPGIIIGDSTTGEMDKIDGPYYFFRFFNFLTKHRNKLPINFIPVSCHRSSTLPLLPVDTLVDWLSVMLTKPTDHKLRSYHLIPDEKIFITEFVEEALKYFELKMKVQRIPFPEVYGSLLPLLKIPKQLVPYMQSRITFKKDQIHQDFPELKSPVYKDYLPAIIKGAREMFK